MRTKHGLIRWALGFSAAIFGLLALGLITTNTPAGRAAIEASVAWFSGGSVSLSGLSGRLPDAPRLARLTLNDPAGTWLTIEDLSLDWSPLRLLLGRADIERLEVGRIVIARQPAPTGEPSVSSPGGLPITLKLGNLRVNRMELAEPVIGQAVAVNAEARVDLTTNLTGDVDLTLRNLDGEGCYTLRGQAHAAGIRVLLQAQEPTHGLLSTLADLPELGAVKLDARLEGPRSALATRVALQAGELSLNGGGTVNLDAETADLTVKAAAPAMHPAPELSWQTLALDAQIHGALDRPNLGADLRIEALTAAGIVMPRLAARLEGEAGAASLRAEIQRLRLPGARPDLLAASPVILRADARLADARRPVSFALEHPLVTLTGEARTADPAAGEMTLMLPDLAPIAAAAGLNAQGRLESTFRFAPGDDAANLQVDGMLAINGGAEPWPALIGKAAKFGLSLGVKGRELTVSRLLLDGAQLNLSAQGRLAEEASDLRWKIALPDLGVFGPPTAGRIEMEGVLDGPADNLNVTADLNGELATGGLPKGPLTARLEARGLPNTPAGKLSARGALAGSPLALAIRAEQAESGLRVTVDQAQWKSALAEGVLTLARGAAFPSGKLAIHMSRLDDFRSLLSHPLSGSLDATLETLVSGGRPRSILQMDVRNAGWADTASVTTSHLTLAVTDPAGSPSVDGRWSVSGLKAGSVAGSAVVSAAGPLNALALNLTGNMTGVGGDALNLGAIARLDLQSRRATVTDMQANWKNETLRLLAPFRIAFADTVTVDRLLLGVRKAELELAGRVSPTLDVSFALHDLPADLAALLAPAFAADGVLNAEARLAGDPGRPEGKVNLEVRGWRLRDGSVPVLPPANLNASAELRDGTANLEGRLRAGSKADLRISGTLPFDPSAALQLHAGGELDLSILDPLLSAQGKRLRGQASLNADMTGTMNEPRPTGIVQIAKGEFQDYGQGMRIHDMNAELRAEGEILRLTRFQGRAGPGQINADGTLDLRAAGRPIALSLTARNAQPLASDRLNVNLDANLSLRGHAGGSLTAAGDIRIRKAEIRIPESMPAQIAVLDVRLPGTRPPAPPPPPPAVGLDLRISAPGQIFARGRGLDAELAGNLRLRGTTDQPVPDGHFTMRRGQFSLAGSTLSFSRGEVGFDGGSLTDPSLNFVSSTTDKNITATLTVGGTAKKPVITLSSIPDLPQDEILAHLLFSRATSNLSPLEMVQIGTAIASLSGITPTIGDPLATVRKGLGLDRLSIGGGTAPTLEAGRYLAPGVYVGGKQGVSGSGTQATVQLDVTENLKLEGAVGTGSPSGTAAAGGAGSVGIRYQYEY
ncbi:translocation/assembly module TamB domain-containing protein [Methylococcus sp. EFPC2]|uniref:translocation/assembly module TamB domain-containing protein n=1 Tax=Methylococcus sp. EFPC2 TaxID=2812648 RepID=UPI001967F64C|nr:translocation/assembly module TamB domain-containing protein [Methylococcus sp. EFPC2]QSA96492.1 translocation/assembly module TamB domain-containing protein [Methylococcus sp. EFPC2]